MKAQSLAYDNRRSFHGCAGWF